MRLEKMGKSRDQNLWPGVVCMFTSDTIKKRISCRTYKSWPLRDDDHQKLNDFLLTNVRGPFGNRLRFQIIDLAAREKEEIKRWEPTGSLKGRACSL